MHHLHGYGVVGAPLPDSVLSDGEAEVGLGAWTDLHQRHRHVDVIPRDRHHRHHHSSHDNRQQSSTTLKAAPPHPPDVLGPHRRQHSVSLCCTARGPSPPRLPAAASRITGCHNHRQGRSRRRPVGSLLLRNPTGGRASIKWLPSGRLYGSKFVS